MPAPYFTTQTQHLWLEMVETVGFVLLVCGAVILISLLCLSFFEAIRHRRLALADRQNQSRTPKPEWQHSSPSLKAQGLLRGGALSRAADARTRLDQTPGPEPINLPRQRNRPMSQRDGHQSVL